MKICSKCKQELDESFFHKSKSRGYQCYCKECSNKRRSKYFKEHRQQEILVRRKRELMLREWFKEIRPKECSKCHDKRWYTIDLHHTNPDEKEYNIAEMMRFSKKKILTEIAKCIPLCSNCHRELHWELKQREDNGSTYSRL